jgi:hypothetical protein
MLRFHYYCERLNRPSYLGLVCLILQLDLLDLLLERLPTHLHLILQDYQIQGLGRKIGRHRNLRR